MKIVCRTDNHFLRKREISFTEYELSSFNYTSLTFLSSELKFFSSCFYYNREMGFQSSMMSVRHKNKRGKFFFWDADCIQYLSVIFLISKCDCLFINNKKNCLRDCTHECFHWENLCPSDILLIGIEKTEENDAKNRLIVNNSKLYVYNKAVGGKIFLKWKRDCWGLTLSVQKYVGRTF